MSAAGTEVRLIDSPTSRSAPTDTDGAFWAYFTEKGPTDQAYKVTSLTEFEDLFGTEVSYSPLWFYARVFFALGGSHLWIARVVGPSPVVASGNLFDQSGSANPGDIALVVTSVDKSAWANGLNVTVTVAGSDFTITVTHDTDTSVSESSGTLADRAAAVIWAAGSDYIRLALGASAEDPRAQAISLSGGTDDNGSAVDAQWATAAGLFTEELGPGQVAFPGRTTDAAHLQLFDHATDNNRRAVADAPDTATQATLTASGDAIDAGGNGRGGTCWWPWAIASSDTPGSTRTIPWSVVQCALLSRSDARGIPRSQPPAGKDYGIVETPIVGLSQAALTKTQRDTLDDHGISVARIVDDQVAAWSNRTCDQSGDPRWASDSGMRVLMAMVAEFDVVGTRYEHKKLDGRRHTIASFGSDLTAVCKNHYDIDDLFGDTPQHAYTVDVGPTVNTTSTIQAKQLKASIQLKITDTAGPITIELTRRLLTEVL